MQKQNWITSKGLLEESRRNMWRLDIVAWRDNFYTHIFGIFFGFFLDVFGYCCRQRQLLHSDIFFCLRTRNSKIDFVGGSQVVIRIAWARVKGEIIENRSSEGFRQNHQKQNIWRFSTQHLRIIAKMAAVPPPRLWPTQTKANLSVPWKTYKLVW